MLSCSQYQLNLPYPEITGGPEPETVTLLHEDYAGMVSEFTALNQYMYQYILLTEKDRSFAHELECIAITEMRHKEMLGKAIVRLGGTPIFATCNSYWCANFVNYVEDPQRMLVSNIGIENAAIANYRFHIQMISNASVRQLLERIILDEELHIRLFNEMMNTFD